MKPAEMGGSLVVDPKTGTAILTITGLDKDENPMPWIYAIALKTMREMGIRDAEIVKMGGLIEGISRIQTMKGGEA